MRCALCMFQAALGLPLPAALYAVTYLANCVEQRISSSRPSRRQQKRARQFTPVIRLALWGFEPGQPGSLAHCWVPPETRGSVGVGCDRLEQVRQVAVGISQHVSHGK